MKNKPKVIILKTEGVNCDEELSYAFQIAGGNPKIVHVNELRSKKENLNNYNILAIPGGFSYGDDVISGKILAVELTSFFSKELKKFIERKDTLIIGVCNGFQVLVRTGLLPFGIIGKMQATLTNNDSGHFDCRWVNLKIDKNNTCVFLKDLVNLNVSYQVAHGEGKFFADKNIIEKIEKNNLVAFRYIDEKGKPTQKYPENPNGSLNAIAGICDPTGRILGLMPHPERFVKIEQHPNWRRMKIDKPLGLPIFENMIKYIENHNRKAIIFDMDGVIIDSEPLFDAHMLTYLPSLGIKISKNYLELFRGANITLQWKIIKRDFNLQQSLEELMQNARNSYYNFLLQKRVEPIAGVKNLMVKLKTQGYVLALASSASKKRIDLFLSKTHLSTLFSVILCGDDVKKSKPAPDIYLKTAKKLNISPNNCIVIEDAENGVLSAKAAGMKVIAYAGSQHNKQDLSQADVITYNFDKITTKIFL